MMIQALRTSQHVACSFLFFVALFLFFAGNLTGAIIPVGPPPASIQAAITAAASGDTVQLSAGTYIETPEIVGKNLTLVGVSTASSIIQCPTTPLVNFFTYTFTGVTYYPVLLCDSASTINIQNLTVDANNQGVNSPGFFVGLGYHNAGGTISGVNVINARFPTAPGDQTGNGIEVAIDTGPSAINIINSTVSMFEKTGIGVRGVTLTFNINANTISNNLSEPSNAATPNGITIQDNATGIISQNMIEFIRSPFPGVDACGILPFGAGPNLTITNNNINNCDLGIAAVNTGDQLLIQNNQCNENVTMDAIGIVVMNPINLTTLIGNTVSNNGLIGMLLDSTAPMVRQSPDMPSSSIFILPPNPPYSLANNIFIGGPIGLEVLGTGSAGPVVSMNSDQFTGQTSDFIVMNACPNDIWPTTHTVSFDGLITGVNMTFAQFQQTLTKIIDKHNNPALGLVLDFIPLPILPPTHVRGVVLKNEFLTQTNYFLKVTWQASPSANVVLYRIFKHGNLVAEIPATSPLVFKIPIRSKHKVKGYEIAAVNADGLQSSLVPVKVVHESD